MKCDLDPAHFGNVFFAKNHEYEDFNRSPFNYSFIGTYEDIINDIAIYEDLDSKGKAIIFHGITFKEDFEFANRYFTKNRNIVIKRCTFLKRIENLIDVNITFEDCEFYYQPVDEYTYPAEFDNIDNSTIKFINPYSDIKFINVRKSSIDVNCKKGTSFTIYKSKDSKFKIYSSFEESRRNINMEIVDCEINELNLHDIEIKEISFSNAKIGKIDISKCHGEQFILNNENFLSETHFNEIQYSGNYLNTIKIENDSSKTNFIIDKICLEDSRNIFLKNCHLKTLYLGSGADRDISVVDCTAEELIFDNIICKENINFDLFELRGGAKLILKKSILNNLRSSPSFLHNTKYLECSDSTLHGIALFNFKFLGTDVIKNSKSSINDKIDFARELSHILTEQGNVHYAKNYKAFELELRKSLNDKSINWVDKTILNLNFWSNAHGTQPFKAVIWIFMLIACHLFLVWLSLRCQNISLTFRDFVSSNYSYYFKPITFLSDIEEYYSKTDVEVTFNPVFKILDFIYKILYAYLVYQFIAAFRKFNK